MKQIFMQAEGINEEGQGERIERAGVVDTLSSL
jgi:hypothetical protein